jgi:hypothetical protein
MREMTKAMETLLHHIATVAAEQWITIRTADGESTKGKFDTVFTDGLSIVVGNHKDYFPLTGITKIVVHPPKAALPEGTKRRSIASQLAR